MIDFDKLLPFIKRALEKTANVSPEEVLAVLNEGYNSGPQEDQNAETVDSEMMDRSLQTTEEARNDEGKLLEQAFRDLDVEEAIKTVEERKQFEGNQDGATVSYKSAWEQLIHAYGNNSR